MNRRSLVFASPGPGSGVLLTATIAGTGAEHRAKPKAAVKAAPPPRASVHTPKTPDGQPDLQGFWTNSTYVPLERPTGRRRSSTRPKKPRRR